MALMGALAVALILTGLTALANPYKKMVVHEEAAERLTLVIEHYERRLDELTHQELPTDGR